MKIHLNFLGKMSNIYLLITSFIFFCFNIYIKIHRELPFLFFEYSTIAGIISILNHYYDNLNIRKIDRAYISAYIIYVFLTMEDFKIISDERYIIYHRIGEGTISIIIAIYLRYLFENNKNNDIDSLIKIKFQSLLCTIFHLFSHFSLLYGYYILTSKCKII